jgi:hypothetical protein
MANDFVESAARNESLLFTLTFDFLTSTSHGGGRASSSGQSMWYLLQTEWHWDKHFSEPFGFNLHAYVQKISTSIFIFIAILDRKINGRSLGTFQ